MAITIATRRSKLALWQSEHIAALLRSAHPGLDVTLNPIDTRGDKILDKPLGKIGEKGLFTAELEASLRDGTSDIAVHSLKDLPTEMPAGLVTGAIPAREDPRDVLLIPHTDDKKLKAKNALAALPANARLGSSSPRRQAQALAQRPDLALLDLRGNVETRLRKLLNGQYDAIILAAAGLIRLGLLDAASGKLSGDYAALSACPLAAPEWLPAPCQGAIAVQCRADDAQILTLLAVVENDETRRACEAEKHFLRAISGGCQAPAGALVMLQGSELVLHAGVFSPDGTRVWRGDCVLESGRELQSVESLATWVLSSGAGPMLAKLRIS